ncbi:hypothetical protein M082_0265 [Bacteroides fragilis str. 3725 D9 ii]|nr:hypothetical protein M088_0529 [Bacteroides ovatus str. 3725 D1 iv]KDS22482.1 hypothetical protein M082_0265 [Bacteroides fragilis str. 3725 D9 ii]
MIVVGVHLFYRMIMRRGCILALFCGNEDKKKSPDCYISKTSVRILLL